MSGLPWRARAVRNSMTRYRLVHFFGPDGAGKSTQVDRLAAYLQSRGVSVHKTWVRSPHSLAFLATRLLCRLGISMPLYNPFGYIASRPRVDTNRATKLLWVLLELVSLIPVVLREVVVPVARGRTLVAERYMLDSVVTIGYFLQDEHFIDGWAAWLLYRLIPRDTLFVFLDVDYPSVLERRGNTAEPEEFIDFQRRAYQVLATRVHALAIYTPQHTIEDTQARIRAAVDDHDRASVGS
jgi:thymidylate kinase